MTVAQIQAYIETPASILESEIAPALDRILLEHGHELRPHHLQEIRRVLTIVEELFSELESDEKYNE
jgi:hypothetical protein